MNLRQIAAATLATAALAVGAFGTSTTASAASGDTGYVPVGVNYRYTPYIQSNNIAFTSKGATWIAFSCWTDTQSTPDNGAWRRWFRTVVGPYWVAADLVQHQPSLPHC